MQILDRIPGAKVQPRVADVDQTLLLVSLPLATVHLSPLRIRPSRAILPRLHRQNRIFRMHNAMFWGVLRQRVGRMAPVI